MTETDTDKSFSSLLLINNKCLSLCKVRLLLTNTKNYNRHFENSIVNYIIFVY
jgi:hypothetical protein